MLSASFFKCSVHHNKIDKPYKDNYTENQGSERQTSGTDFSSKPACPDSGRIFPYFGAVPAHSIPLHMPESAFTSLELRPGHIFTVQIAI